jgi:tripartite-type tricarboxylate transporter receptor subunit TctC
MLIASPSVIVSPLLIRDLPYDVARDFSPVALMAIFPTALVVGAQVKAASAKELIELAKAAPGKLNYATAGRGTASHLSAELMRKMTGVNIVEVAYRATAQALNDTISGEVAMYFPNLVSALPHIKSGRLYGIVVPARTPAPVIKRLHSEIDKALREPEVRQRFLSLGGDIVSGGPDALDKTMRGGTQKWGALVREIDARGK